jgi:hypothetical protein
MHRKYTETYDGLIFCKRINKPIIKFLIKKKRTKSGFKKWRNKGIYIKIISLVIFVEAAHET